MRFEIRLVIIFLSLCGVSLPACMVNAGSYSVVADPVDFRGFPLPKPIDKELCQKYEKYLNSFSDLSYPLICKRPPSERFTDFTKPKWDSLDILTNLHLLEQIEKKMWHVGVENKFDYDKWVKRVNQGVTEGRLRLYKSKFDITGDGREETIIKYDYGGHCNPQDMKWYKSQSGINYFKLRPEDKKVEDIVGFRGRIDVFIFNNHTYVDQYITEAGKHHGVLSVYQTSKHGPVEVCRYEYNHGEIE